MAGMDTLQMIKMIPTFDGCNYVEWTRSFNDIPKITWPFLSKISSERTEGQKKILVIYMTMIQILVK